MPRILVVTQGALAEELVRGAHTIAGQATRLETLSLEWDERLEVSERKLAAALAKETPNTEADNGVLILVDVPGGTPFNVARKFARAGRVEVLSGVNLPMVVRLCCPGCQERSVGELAGWLQEKGRQSICRAEDNGRAGGDSDGG